MNAYIYKYIEFKQINQIKYMLQSNGINQTFEGNYDYESKSKLTSEIENLQKENNGLTAQVKELISQTKSDSNRLIERENELKSLRSQIEYYQNENEDLKKSLYNTRQEMTSYSKENKKSKIEAENLRREIASIYKEKESLSEINSELQSTIKMLKTKNTELQSDLNDYMGTAQKLQKDKKKHLSYKTNIRNAM